MRKPDFCIGKTKAQISCAVTSQLIRAFDFATRIVQLCPPSEGMGDILFLVWLPSVALA